MKKYLRIGFIFLAILIIIAYFLRIKLVHHSSLIHSSETILPIHKLEKQKFTDVKSFIGSIQAIQSVDIVPYLSGFLNEVRVHSGDEVHEGQTLFLLDERIPLADLNQAKESVSQAYANRANAETYYLRMKNTESKAISPTELEQAKTEFEAADAAYQKALAAKNQAQTLYDYTIIQAPISGWVGNITATIGEYLSPEGKILATIIAFSPIRLNFSVPMAVYNQQRSLKNAQLQVILADHQILEFQDFKVMHDNKVDPSTDSLSFFIDVQNSDKKLVPGAYIEVRFLFSEEGILVNKDWINLTPNGAEVFVLKDGIVQKRQVKIGASVKNQYWIQWGLSEGEDIITVRLSPYQIGKPAQGVSQ